MPPSPGGGVQNELKLLSSSFFLCLFWTGLIQVTINFQTGGPIMLDQGKHFRILHAYFKAFLNIC